MSFSALQSQLAAILGMASIAARWIWGRGRHQAAAEGRQERRSQSLQCSYSRLAAARSLHQGGDTLGMDRGGGGHRRGARHRSGRRARFASGSSAATGSSEGGEGGEGGPSSPAPCSSPATELTTLEVTLCSRGDTGTVQPLEPPSKQELQQLDVSTTFLIVISVVRKFGSHCKRCCRLPCSQEAGEKIRKVQSEESQSEELRHQV